MLLPLSLLGLASASIHPSSCVFSFPADDSEVDPAHPFHTFDLIELHDVRYYDPSPHFAGWFYSFSPCGDVDPRSLSPTCGDDDDVPAPAYQVTSGECIRLGAAGVAAATPLTGSTAYASAPTRPLGLALALGKGNDGRSAVLEVECADVAPPLTSLVTDRKHMEYLLRVKARAGCPQSCARDAATGAVCGGHGRGECFAVGGAAATCVCAMGHSGPCCGRGGEAACGSPSRAPAAAAERTPPAPPAPPSAALLPSPSPAAPLAAAPLRSPVASAAAAALDVGDAGVTEGGGSGGASALMERVFIFSFAAAALVILSRRRLRSLASSLSASPTLAAVALLSLVFVVFFSMRPRYEAHAGPATLPQKGASAGIFTQCSAPPPQRLWAVGLATGTDKFEAPGSPTNHRYQSLYEELLGPLHCQPLNILEIGLGCNVGISEAGKSLAMWLHYFPLATVTVFEYDEACVAAWRAQDPMRIGFEVIERRVSFFVGDQAKANDLQPLLSRAPFDFILDDGGHSFKQQVVSMGVLLPAVRPGGLYIMEDLGTSFSDPGHRVSAPWHDSPVTTAAFISKVIALLHMPASKPPCWQAEPVDEAQFPYVTDIVGRTKHVTCMQEVCVFRVWGEGEAGAAPPQPAKGVAHHEKPMF